MQINDKISSVETSYKLFCLSRLFYKCYENVQWGWKLESLSLSLNMKVIMMFLGFIDMYIAVRISEFCAKK